MFNPGAINNNSPIGGNSLLKIGRDLYSALSTGGKGQYAAGFTVNNYPNGIEVTSYISATPSTGPSANDSVAISVGATTYLNGGTTGTAAATGFFVSNTGENIAIGQSIDYTAAIGVSGAGTDYAIKAKGNIGVTGSVEVIGNLSVTGDTILRTGVVRIFDTSAVAADFRFENGRISNDTKSLHTDTTTNPTSGIIYMLPGQDCIASGQFSFPAGSGIISGTWMRAGSVIQVAATLSPTNTAIFYLPVQPSGTATISNVRGVAVVNNGTNKSFSIVGSGTTNAQIYNDGSGIPTGGGNDYHMTYQYMIK